MVQPGHMTSQDQSSGPGLRETQNPQVAPKVPKWTEMGGGSGSRGGRCTQDTSVCVCVCVCVRELGLRRSLKKLIRIVVLLCRIFKIIM